YFKFCSYRSNDDNKNKTYIEEYFTSLPTTKRAEKPKYINLYEKNKGVEKIVNKGKEAKAMVRLTLYGDYTYNEQENINASAVETILTNKLIERLREEESGVYGTGARFSYSKFPKPRYSFLIVFGTSVDKYPSLINSSMDEIKKLKANGPS